MIARHALAKGRGGSMVWSGSGGNFDRDHPLAAPLSQHHRIRTFARRRLARVDGRVDVIAHRAAAEKVRP